MRYVFMRICVTRCGLDVMDHVKIMFVFIYILFFFFIMFDAYSVL